MTLGVVKTFEISDLICYDNRTPLLNREVFTKNRAEYI